MAEDKEALYQGGDDDQAHSYRDEQQTWDSPDTRTQPGLGNIRQTGQCPEGLGEDNILIYFTSNKKTHPGSGWDAHRWPLGSWKHLLNSEMPQPGVVREGWEVPGYPTPPPLF